MHLRIELFFKTILGIGSHEVKFVARGAQPGREFHEIALQPAARNELVMNEGNAHVRHKRMTAQIRG